MRARAEWRAVFGMLGAASGVGLASGRGLTVFFGQLKGMAWAGVAFAAAIYGVLTGMMASQTWEAGPSRGAARLRAGLKLLLAAVTAAAMLRQLGRVGELALPLRHSYAFGALFGLTAALYMCRMGEGGRAALGCAAVLALALFFTANALDTRPVQLRAAEAVEFTLAGNLRAALLLALLFASLNACASEWAMSKNRPGALRPAALGVKAGAMLGLLLAAAVWALHRGGDAAMAQPMPWVVMSARWGLAGFWLCEALKALCAAATLSAAMGVLARRGAGEAPAAWRIGAGIVAATLFGVLSFDGVG